jgi:hypothetical protein
VVCIDVEAATDEKFGEISTVVATPCPAAPPYRASESAVDLLVKREKKKVEASNGRYLSCESPKQRSNNKRHDYKEGRP